MISGTVFHGGKPRIVSINGIKTDAEFAPLMVYAANDDRPGCYVDLFGNAGINIATIRLGATVKAVQRSHSSQSTGSPGKGTRLDPAASRGRAG